MISIHFQRYNCFIKILDIEFSFPMLNELISQDQKQTHAEGFLSSFTLCEDFINPIEESNLLLEVQPHLERQVYEKDHWDEVSIVQSSLFMLCMMLM